MQLKLTFDEIGNLIHERTGKELPMSYSGPHSVRVAYKVPLMGPVGLDITVDRVEGSNLYLSYDGNKAIEMMLQTALNHYKDQPGMDIVELLDGNRLLLALGKNPQTAQLFERITLHDIHFDERSVMIDFTPNP